MKNLEINNAANIGKQTVGLEFENPVIKKDGNAIDFATIQRVWRSFEKHQWSPRFDPIIENVIDGLSKTFDGVSVSILSDSGSGNFELALSPQENIHAAKTTFEKVFSECRSIFREHDLLLAGIAMQPGTIVDYDTFRRRNAMYLAWNAMESSDVYDGYASCAISAHQVGIGIGPYELVDTTNELIKITGLIIALCGNSPIQNWKVTPFKEWRIICMSHVRFVSNVPGFEKLLGFPERPFRSLADLFTYFWDVPSIELPMIRNDEWIVPDEKINLLQFFTKKKMLGHTLKGEQIEMIPDVSDISWASIQFWPHAKPHIALDSSKVKLDAFLENLKNDSLEKYLDGKLTNCYAECRAGAAAPIGEEMALPALMLGVTNNLSELKKLTKRYSWEDWRALVFEAAVKGMDATIQSKSIVPLLEDLYSIAQAGLIKRGFGEEQYLDVIQKRIETRKNPADLALEHFRKGKKDFLDYICYT